MITYHDINYFEIIIANYYCMFIRLFIIVVMLKNYLLICRLIRSIINISAYDNGKGNNIWTIERDLDILYTSKYSIYSI